MDIRKFVAEEELYFEAGNPLVTVMDMNGVITYANSEFKCISGFSHEELIGASHDMLWHSDMPKICQTNLWLMIKNNKSYRGMEKNRCKNGSFFWSDSISTSFMENGQTAGYITVRSAPSREQADKAEALYKKIKAGEVENNRLSVEFYNAVQTRISKISGSSVVFGY